MLRKQQYMLRNKGIVKSNNIYCERGNIDKLKQENYSLKDYIVLNSIMQPSNLIG